MDKVRRDRPSASTRELGSLVTVIVVPRERFGLTGRCIASLDANTPEGVPMVYVDAGSPAYVVEELRNRFAEERLSIVSTGRYMAPNEARNAGAAGVGTRYLAFVDNDVLVRPDWLRHLVDCAEATGADAVSPLCLLGTGEGETVHFSGGHYDVAEEGARRHFRAVFDPPVEVPYSEELHQGLSRGETGFLEPHAFLMRTDILRAIGGFDEAVTSVHDHHDFSLAILEHRGEIYIEPASVSCYRADGEWLASDVPFFHLRWCEEWNRESLDYFYQKRAYIRGKQYVLAKEWLGNHMGLIGVKHVPRGSAGTSPTAPQARVQTNLELYRQLSALGFRDSELESVRNAYEFSAKAFAGMYRASGRPFLNHLVATAGIMAAQGGSPQMIVAALMHDLYKQSALGRTSLPFGPALGEVVRSGFGVDVEAVLDRYAVLEESKKDWPAADPNRCPLPAAKAVAIRVANDLDDYLAGEFAYSAKAPAPIVRRDGDYAAAVVGLLGFGDLTARLLDAAAAEAEPVVPALRSDRSASFVAGEGAADAETAKAMLRSARRRAGDALMTLAVRLPGRAVVGLLGRVTQSQAWIVPRIVVGKLLTDPRWLVERVRRRTSRLLQRAKAPPHA